MLNGIIQINFIAVTPAELLTELKVILVLYDLELRPEVLVQSDSGGVLRTGLFRGSPFNTVERGFLQLKRFIHLDFARLLLEKIWS